MFFLTSLYALNVSAFSAGHVDAQDSSYSSGWLFSRVCTYCPYDFIVDGGFNLQRNHLKPILTTVCYPQLESRPRLRSHSSCSPSSWVASSRRRPPSSATSGSGFQRNSLTTQRPQPHKLPNLRIRQYELFSPRMQPSRRRRPKLRQQGAAVPISL
jgi:hypothetical protein